MKYYGVIVSLLDGSIDEIETEANWKPEQEDGGMMTFCKWFKNDEERKSYKEYAKLYILEHRWIRKEISQLKELKHKYEDLIKLQEDVNNDFGIKDLPTKIKILDEIITEKERS